MSTVKVEQVLVVPTELFHECGLFQGFSNQTDTYLPVLLESKNISYRPRDEMEKDPTFKQLIPYCVFQFTDEDGKKHVFQYTRGSGQGESRLHSKRSVGIGGHISSVDQDTASVYHAGLERELEEEVMIDTTYEQDCVGLINDDSNDVGKVHLGVVHVFRVAEPNVTARETEIEDAGFRPVTKLLEEIDQFETWSQIALKSIYA